MRTLLLFLLLICFASCSSDEEQDYLRRWEISQCHSELNWDSLSLSNAVVARWEWEFSRLFSSGVDDELYDGLVLDFRGDNTVEVISDLGRDTVDWRYQNRQVNIDSGRIFNPVAQSRWFYLCEDEMMFSDISPDLNGTVEHTFIRI